MSNRLSAFLLAGGKLLSHLGKNLYAHMKKVESQRYCKCCGALAGYYANTAYRDMDNDEMAIPLEEVFGGAEPAETPSLILAATPEIYLCREHHPLIGAKRNEALEYLGKIHRKLAFHLITPNPYR